MAMQTVTDAQGREYRLEPIPGGGIQVTTPEGDVFGVEDSAGLRHVFGQRNISSDNAFAERIFNRVWDNQPQSAGGRADQSSAIESAIGGLMGQVPGLQAQIDELVGRTRTTREGVGTDIRNLDDVRGRAKTLAQDFDTTGTEARTRFDALSGRAEGLAGRAEERAGEFFDIGRGGPDAQFDEFREAQFDIFQDQAQRQRSQTGQFFNQRGLGDSAAALNALQGVNEQLGLQERGLGAELGRQSLQRRERFLDRGSAAEALAGGFLGQAGGLAQTGFGLEQGALQGAMSAEDLQRAIIGQQTSARGTQVGMDESAINALISSFEAGAIPAELLIALQNAGLTGGE